MRTLTVWLAEWPVLAAGVAGDRPAAVFRANRVVARTAAAAAAGVAHGERRRAAQRRCPELEVLAHDPAADARRFEPVVRAVAELAPRLEVVEPGWLCLAARGPSRYFGGEAAVAARLVGTVTALLGEPAVGMVGVGIADGRSASAIAARRAVRTPDGTTIVAPGGSADYLAPLPVGWLRHTGDAGAELVELFARLGLRTLGQLAELSPADVLSRFGPEGLAAHRVASATDTRPTTTAGPPPEWSCTHVFDEPVADTGPVVFVAKRLADTLTGQLADSGRVCTRLVVTFETDHGEHSERIWYRATGLSSTAIVERVRWQLAGWVGDGDLTAGVTLVRLTPDEVRRDEGVQARLWGGRSRADTDAARAVVRLSGLAGEQAVRVPEWAGGRLPAERYRLVPAVSADLDDPSGRLARGEAPWPGAHSGPAPAVVPPEPVAVELLDAGGTPVRVSGRGAIAAEPAVLVSGQTRRRVVAWAGPWPVEQRWWSGQSRRLARVQVLTGDGRAHLVALERGRWWLLAGYD